MFTKTMFTKTIKGRMGIIATVSILVVILALVILNTGSTQKVMVSDAENLLYSQAKDNALVMDYWLRQQGSIVHTMKTALEKINSTDTEMIMDYLEANLKENDNALMYYCCFGYDGGVFPADHSKLDLDPTTRGWWKQAISEKALIYTEPYKDFATGQMIVSIAEPMVLGGQQAVILADITIDRLVELTKTISEGTDLETFLVTEDGSVVTHKNEEFLPKEKGNTILTDEVSIDLGAKETFLFRDYDGEKKYAAIGDIEVTGWKLGVMERKALIQKQITASNIAAFVVGILLLVASVFVLLFCISKMLIPLDKMKQFIKERVIGVQNCRECNDEVEEITYLLSEMEEQFIQAIRQTKEKSGDIQERMSDASEHVAEISRNIVKISARMRDTSAHVDCQTDRQHPEYQRNLFGYLACG